MSAGQEIGLVLPTRFGRLRPKTRNAGADGHVAPRIASAPRVEHRARPFAADARNDVEATLPPIRAARATRRGAHCRVPLTCQVSSGVGLLEAA